MLLGVWESVKEWTLTFLRELPLWELESQWTSESSKSDCRLQHSMDWRVPYIIGNILKRKCSKWARMTHLDILHTSYSEKKGRESNWQFDSRPLKVKYHPNFLACRCCATYCWKALNESYNFSLNFISIEGLYAKLLAPKVTGFPVGRILRFPLGSSKTKWHLSAGPMAGHRVYYKEEGGGFP
jgi:hypothetical protein